MYVFVHMFVCRDCRVVKDMATGKSKGYGFVSFFNKWVSVSSMLLCFSRFSLKKYYCCTSYVSVKIVESFSLHILYVTSIQSFSCQLASLNVFQWCSSTQYKNASPVWIGYVMWLSDNLVETLRGFYFERVLRFLALSSVFGCCPVCCSRLTWGIKIMNAALQR